MCNKKDKFREFKKCIAIWWSISFLSQQDKFIVTQQAHQTHYIVLKGDLKSTSNPLYRLDVVSHFIQASLYNPVFWAILSSTAESKLISDFHVLYCNQQNFYKVQLYILYSLQVFQQDHKFSTSVQMRDPVEIKQALTSVQDVYISLHFQVSCRITLSGLNLIYVDIIPSSLRLLYAIRD